MATESTMLVLGTPAPPFTLPEPATGATVSLDELTGPALVVTFIYLVPNGRQSRT
jgi:peroxiredoxin